MRLKTTQEGKSLLASLRLWRQGETEFPTTPEGWRGLLSTNIFLDLCSDVGPALEVETASFMALYVAVQSYSKYSDDWSSAELYLACRSLALCNCLVDVYPPVPATPIVRSILSQFYSAVANKDRLQIVLLLREVQGLLSVTEVAACLAQSDKVQSVRRHLRILHDARIVERHWEDGAGRYQYDRRAIMANLELTQEALL